MQSAPVAQADAPVPTHPSSDTPSLQPIAAPQPAPSAAPVGRLRRVGSVSIKAVQTNAPKPAQTQQAATQPLDEAGLRDCWDSMLQAMQAELPKLADLLKDKELRMGQEDFFTIIVSNSFQESEIKPHLIRMLTYLRSRSGRPNLNCKTEVVYEEKEAKVYTPRDKYDVMQKTNPALDTFRVLFPEVDY